MLAQLTFAGGIGWIKPTTTMREHHDLSKSAYSLSWERQVRTCHFPTLLVIATTSILRVLRSI